MRRRSSQGNALELPEWMFVVDEVDDTPGDISILQELDIDISLIYRTVMWMITHPWIWIFSSTVSSANSHPLCLPSSQREFWGPCFVIVTQVCLYGVVLWASKLTNVPWIFGIWGIATVFQHIVGRAFLQNSTFAIHSVVLGYSVAALIPVCVLALLLKYVQIVSDILKIVGILWATLSAFITYLHVCFVVPQERESKRYLLVMPVLLMHVYLVSLIPRL